MATLSPDGAVAKVTSTDLLLSAIRECRYPHEVELCQAMARAYAKFYWGDNLNAHPAPALQACLWSTAELGGAAVADLLESAIA